MSGRGNYLRTAIRHRQHLGKRAIELKSKQKQKNNERKGSEKGLSIKNRRHEIKRRIIITRTVGKKKKSIKTKRNEKKREDGEKNGRLDGHWPLDFDESTAPTNEKRVVKSFPFHRGDEIGSSSWQAGETKKPSKTQ